MLNHPASHIVTVGMTVSLYCNVSGIKVSFAWDRRTKDVEWSRIRNSQTDKYDVRNIQKYQQYRCIAGNGVGTAIISNVATIQVLSKHYYNYTNLYGKSNILLEITTHPHNKQATIGSIVTLTCTSSLSSDVTFSWIHNDTNIRQQQPINSVTSILEISNMSYSDSGSYMCIVRRGSLSARSNTATITVNGKLNLYILNYFIDHYYV